MLISPTCILKKKDAETKCLKIFVDTDYTCLDKSTAFCIIIGVDEIYILDP